jgi:hypothetical protein
MKSLINKQNILILAIMLSAFALYWLMFDFMRWNQFDSPSYIGASRLLFGLEGGFDFQSRIAKPVALIIPGALEFLFNINPEFSFIFQNSILFIISGFFVFNILKSIFPNKGVALSGMIAFISCQSFAIYSLMVLSDIWGWFFALLVIWASIKHKIQKTQNYKTLFFIGLITGVGVLAKESAVIGIIFSISLLLFSKSKINVKIKQIVLLILGFALPMLAIQALLQFSFDNSIFLRVAEAREVSTKDGFHISQLWQLYRVMDVFWIITFIGIISSIRKLVKRQASEIETATITGLIITFCLMPVWPYFVDRVLFMIAPLNIILFAVGLLFIPTRHRLPIVLAGSFLNIFITWLIYKHHIPGLLEPSLVLFLSICFLSILSKRAKQDINPTNC